MKWLLSTITILAINYASGQHYQTTSLKAGEYKVGFASSIHYDLGRPPIMEQQRNFRNGRAVHISAWYPASIGPLEKPMQFSVYVDDIARMVNPEAATDKTRKESIRLMKFFLSQLHGDTTALNTHLSSLLNSTTTSHLNATPTPGQFLVIIYPESSYQNNLLCEYLASNGYIVVSVSRHGTFDVEFEWQSVRGIESLVQDCQFAFGITKKEFNLREPELAVMGVGMNASAGLGWMMRSDDVDALVSLEGGILTGYEYNLIQKSPWFDKAKVVKPMLVMHSPHESVSPDLIDNYKYADRYMVHFPRMSEFYYLNYGIWEKLMPGILGPVSGDTRVSNEWMMQYSFNFLEYQLKKRVLGKDFFTNIAATNKISNGFAMYTFKPRYEIPPSDSDLETMKQNYGFNTMLAEVIRHQQQDPQSFSFDTFISIGQKLIRRKGI